MHKQLSCKMFAVRWPQHPKQLAWMLVNGGCFDERSDSFIDFDRTCRFFSSRTEFLEIKCHLQDHFGPARSFGRMQHPSKWPHEQPIDASLHTNRPTFTISHVCAFRWLAFILSVAPPASAAPIKPNSDTVARLRFSRWFNCLRFAYKNYIQIFRLIEITLCLRRLKQCHLCLVCAWFFFFSSFFFLSIFQTFQFSQSASCIYEKWWFYERYGLNKRARRTPKALIN